MLMYVFWAVHEETGDFGCIAGEAFGVQCEKAERTKACKLLHSKYVLTNYNHPCPMKRSRTSLFEYSLTRRMLRCLKPSGPRPTYYMHSYLQICLVAMDPGNTVQGRIPDPQVDLRK